MPNVNMANLRASLEQCVEFCRDNDNRDYCARHLPMLEEALEELKESREETDDRYADWRDRRQDQLQAWKRVAKLLDETQRELNRVNAVGYPDQKVRYWDQELLEGVVEEMIEYLRARTDEIESAETYADKLRRELDEALEEIEKQEKALRLYQRLVEKRTDAMAGAAQAVKDFRALLEDEIGTDHPDYEGIRWPYALSPTEAGL